MSADRDDRIGLLLDRLLPPTAEQPDWQQILSDANMDGSSAATGGSWLARRRRSLLLALAVIVLAVLVPLTALAVSQSWWFLGSGAAPKPISRIAVVATGRWNDVSWTLTAYRSATDGICFALTPRAVTNARGSGAAMNCDTITGVPVTPQSKHATPHAITFLMGSATAGLPAYITGPVIDTAQTVEIDFADGTRMRVDTLPAPTSLDSRIRFYATPLPAGHADVIAVVGHGEGNRTVARLSVQPLPATTTGSGSSNRVSNQGQALPLSPAMKHALRLAHRSTRIRLLASRDGHNFYRLGQRGCWGLGKQADPSTFPPTRRGIAAMVGLILCGKTFPSEARPVLDLSVYGRNKRNKQMHLIRLAGIASDAVKTVQLLDTHGRIIRTVPVVSNIYTLPELPPGIAVVVAADQHGRPLARCGPNANAIAHGSYLAARC